MPEDQMSEGEMPEGASGMPEGETEIGNPENLDIYIYFYYGLK